MLQVRVYTPSAPLHGLLFLRILRTTPSGVHSPGFCNGWWVLLSGRPPHWGICPSRRMWPVEKKPRSHGFNSENCAREADLFDLDFDVFIAGISQIVQSRLLELPGRAAYLETARS